jgi:hypothetical protein
MAIHVDDEGYEVGYGKTPEHTKFKKGQSGNPKGRRRKASEPFLYEDPIKVLLRQNIETALIIDKKMPVYLGLLKVMLKKGLHGDTKAVQILLDRTNGLNSILDEQKRKLTEADEAFLARLRKDVEQWG